MIKVSVIMLIYNHEKYIKEAILGVLMQQTDFDIELIVADDGSTDKSGFIVNEIIEKHPNGSWIHYTKHELNKGMNNNFIWAFKKSSGNYVAICEGDDYWTDPLKLQKQVDFLEGNPQYVISYTDMLAFDENGVLENRIGGSKKDMSSLQLKQATPLNTLTVCFRKVFKEIPREMSMAKFGDLFLWSILGAHGKGKYIKDIQPSMYRVHDGGAFSKQPQRRKVEMALLTFNALFAYYYRFEDKKMTKYFHRRSLAASIQLYGKLNLMKTILQNLLAKKH